MDTPGSTVLKINLFNILINGLKREKPGTLMKYLV